LIVSEKGSSRDLEVIMHSSAKPLWQREEAAKRANKIEKTLLGLIRMRIVSWNQDVVLGCINRWSGLIKSIVYRLGGHT